MVETVRKEGLQMVLPRPLQEGLPLSPVWLHTVTSGAGTIPRDLGKPSANQVEGVVRGDLLAGTLWLG